MDADKRRRVLEAIAASDETTTAERIRALELLDRLDAKFPPPVDRTFYADLEQMEPDALHRLLVCLVGDNEFYKPVWDEVTRARARCSVLSREVVNAKMEIKDLRRQLAAAETRRDDGSADEKPRPRRLRAVTPPDGMELRRGWSR